MTCLFEYFESRFWREMVINKLDIWTMLELLQTNKQLNKHKSYVYMLIYQKIFMSHYQEIPVSFIIKYNIDLEYSIYYSKLHLKTLLKHNKTIRGMMEKYINSYKTLHNYKTDIKAITFNQLSKYEELLS